MYFQSFVRLSIRIPTRQSCKAVLVLVSLILELIVTDDFPCLNKVFFTYIYNLYIIENHCFYKNLPSSFEISKGTIFVLQVYCRLRNASSCPLFSVSVVFSGPMSSLISPSNRSCKSSAKDTKSNVHSFFIRIQFFRPRQNILIFLPISG